MVYFGVVVGGGISVLMLMLVLGWGDGLRFVF